MGHCTYFRNGMDCKCGCTRAVVRLECIECGKEPFVCNCAILKGETHFRVIRLSDEESTGDM